MLGADHAKSRGSGIPFCVPLRRQEGNAYKLIVSHIIATKCYKIYLPTSAAPGLIRIPHNSKAVSFAAHMILSPNLLLVLHLHVEVIMMVRYMHPDMSPEHYKAREHPPNRVPWQAPPLPNVRRDTRGHTSKRSPSRCSEDPFELFLNAELPKAATDSTKKGLCACCCATAHWGLSLSPCEITESKHVHRGELLAGSVKWDCSWQCGNALRRGLIVFDRQISVKYRI